MNSKPNPSVWKKIFIETIPYFVVVVLLTMTFYAWLFVNDQIIEESRNNFKFRFNQITQHLKDQKQKISILLNGGRGVLHTSLDINRAEWRSFFKVMDMPNSFQGVQFAAFIMKVPFKTKEEYLRLRHQEGILGLGISPPGDREIYFPVTYIEPENQFTEKILGQDMFADSIRRTVMEYARDDGLPAITSGIPVESGEKDGTYTQIIAFMPVYDPSDEVSNPVLRRKNLAGFVVLGLRVDQLIQHSTIINKNNLHFQIFDGSGSEGKLIYEKPLLMDPNNNSDVWIKADQKIEFFNREWVLQAELLVSSNKFEILPFVWGGGICVSLLVFILLRTLLSINHKANQLADAMSTNLKKANVRLQTTLETAPLGIFLTNAQGEYTFVNMAYQKIVGRSMEECLGNGWGESLHPDDHERVIHNWQEAVTYIKKYSSQHRIQRPTGEISVVRVEAVEMRENLQFVGHIGVVQDMTDIIEGQQALKQSEEISRKALEELKLSQEEERKQTQMMSRMNNLMVDREIIMIDLKNQIKELKAQLEK